MRSHEELNPVDEKFEARCALIDAAESLLETLHVLNQEGDKIDHRIATQRDGCPYGEVHDGLVALCKILWPKLHKDVLQAAFDSGVSLRSAVLFVATLFPEHADGLQA